MNESPLGHLPPSQRVQSELPRMESKRTESVPNVHIANIWRPPGGRVGSSLSHVPTIRRMESQQLQTDEMRVPSRLDSCPDLARWSTDFGRLCYSATGATRTRDRRPTPNHSLVVPTIMNTRGEAKGERIRLHSAVSCADGCGSTCG